jgi:hypothetical protein
MDMGLIHAASSRMMTPAGAGVTGLLTYPMGAWRRSAGRDPARLLVRRAVGVGGALMAWATLMFPIDGRLHWG